MVQFDLDNLPSISEQGPTGPQGKRVDTGATGLALLKVIVNLPIHLRDVRKVPMS